MSSIPASELVSVTPSVLGAGGAAINVVGLILTENARVPIGTVPSFPNALAVSDYFGPTATETALAGVYFAGFENSQALPGSLLFAQYPASAVSAWLRGAELSVSVATLRGYSGTLTVTIDGNVKSASVNLSSATSFSNAAEIIANDLGIEGVQAAAFTASIGGTFTCTSSGTTLTVSTVLTGSLQPGDVVSGTDGTNSIPSNTTIVSQLTGTPGSTGTYQMSAAATPGNLTSCTVTSASTTLNVTSVASGSIGVADVVSGASVTSGTYVTSLISGTGAAGTYGLSGSGQTISSESMTAYTPAVQWDPILDAFVIYSGTTGTSSSVSFASGALAGDLLLTQALGAVQSPGAAAAAPSAFMNGVVGVTTDWVTFMTAFNPDASGNANKQLFAAWAGAQDDRYAYVAWDTDTSPTTQNPATSSLGYILQQNGNSGTVVIYDPSGGSIAAFVMGAAASINFNQPNGRITFAYKAQGDLTAGVTTATAAQNLLANGYNFYGAYGAANANFVWYQNGSVTGPFAWLDSFVNQVWLNANLQLDLLEFFQGALSVPFSAAGATAIEQALADQIAAGLSFGAYGPGPISASQANTINAAVGSQNAAAAVQNQGWYLYVVPANAAVQAARGPQQVNFYYNDRGSVQTLELSSVAIE